MIHLFCEYIKYCWKAKRRHGVHSPFMYDFGDNCLSMPVPSSINQEFKRLQKTFLSNKDSIEVYDLGSGSKKLKQKRPIRKIAKISGTNQKYGRLLYRLVAHYKANHILELGTSLGLGTYMLAAGNSQAKITTIEGCRNTSFFAQKHFPSPQKEQVHFVNDSFFHYLKSLKSEIPYDLIFIDGDHSRNSLLEQLRLLSNFIHEETLIILDDIRWSRDMENAWEALQKNKDYHVTIDFFRMGIIIKRTHQEKENFVMR